jgi:hypothetical protein
MYFLRVLKQVLKEIEVPSFLALSINARTFRTVFGNYISLPLKEYRKTYSKAIKINISTLKIYFSQEVFVCFLFQRRVTADD